MIRVLLGGLAAAILAAGQVPGGGGAASARLAEVQQKAERALEQGRVAEAVAQLEGELRRAPEWKEGWWTLGWALYRSGHHERARPVFVRLVRMDESRAASWLMLGLCEFQAGDYAMSLDDLQRGRAMGIPASLGIDTEVAVATASAQLVLGKFEYAQLTLDAAVREGAGRDQVSLALGLAALRIPVLPGRAEEALESAQLRMARSIGEILWTGASGKSEKAAKAFSAVVLENASTPRIHAAFGEWLLARGEKDRAKAEFEAELAASPNSVRARIGLAWLAYEAGELELAKRLSAEAVSTEPKNTMAHYLLGRTMLSMEEKGEAVRELELARTLEPASARVRYALSRAYASTERSADAEREMREFERLKAVEKAMRTKGRLSEDELRAAEK